MSNIGLPVPTDYKKPTIDLLYTLIEYSNPGFTAQFPKGTIVFSAPTVVAIVDGDAYKTDTSVKISSAPGAGKIGSQTIRYRRIDLSTLFKQMAIRLNDYQPSSALPEANWRSSFRANYGINIADEDFLTGGGIGVGTTLIQIRPTALCYKGSFSINWVIGKRPITVLITDANRALPGRLYPGGNDFTTPGRKPQGEFLTFCQDASNISATLETITTGAAATDVQLTAVVNFLLANTARTDWNKGSASTGTGGISGMNWFKYTLPNAAVPEANSSKYNRCIVIQSYAAAWFADKIIIHYNV